MVTKILRHYDQEERQTDGSRHLDTISPVLLRAFAEEGLRDSDEGLWLHLSKRPKNNNGSLCDLRAVQGHPGGVSINPELMNDTLIPNKWKEHIYHSGISWNFQSILGCGIIPGGKENDKAEQAVFFAPLYPLGNTPDEEDLHFDFVSCTVVAHRIFSCTVVAKTWPHAHGASHEAHCLRFVPKQSHPIAQRRTSRHTWWHQARALLSHSLFSLSLSLTNPAEILTEFRPFTGNEPKRLVEDQDYKHFSKDRQLIEHEDLLVKSLSFHQSIQRKASRHRTGIGLGGWATSFSVGFTTAPTGARSKCRTIAILSLWTRKHDEFISISDKYRETCRIVVKPTEEFSLRHQQVFGSIELFIRFSNPANVSTSLLDRNRDHLLVAARSELMKQEYKVDSLDICICDLQQQVYVRRLELEDVHHGHVESRREQPGLQEGFVCGGRSVSRLTRWEKWKEFKNF